MAWKSAISTAIEGTGRGSTHGSVRGSILADEMQLRLGGLVVAVVLTLGACGSDGEAAGPSAAGGRRAEGVELEMVSARDTLPPAPPGPGALSVVLTHPGGPLDPGLDAAAAALAQRPDLHVAIAVAGAPGVTTMSGFPVAATGATSADAVATALVADPDIDLVVVGIGDGHGIGAHSVEAEVAAARDVPALLVGAGRGPEPDLAAATMQLLDVLDLEVDRILGGDVHRLAVPSCERGMLRGRLATRPAVAPPAELRADCTTAVVPGAGEAEAYDAGYATLTQLR